MTKARDLANFVSGTASTIDTAEITNSAITNDKLGSDISAAKLTAGTVPTARLGSGTANSSTFLAGDSTYKVAATEYDDNKIVNDISTLALHQATNSNAVKYNLTNSNVDVYQDSSAITNLTNCARNSSGEYVSSAVAGAETEYDYDGASTKAKAKWNGMASNNGTYYEIDNDGDTGYSDTRKFIPSIALSTGDYGILNNNNPGSSSYIIYDFGSAITWTGKFRIGKQNTWGDVNQFKMEYSLDDSSYSNVNLSGASADSVAYGSVSGSGSATGGAFSNGASDGTGNLSQHQTSGRYTSIATFDSNNSFTARYIKTTLLSQHSGVTNNFMGWGMFAPFWQPLSTSATGNYESTAQTANASVNKISGVVTYTNASGTATLNTDLIMQVSADNGSNWSNATLTAAGTFSSGVLQAVTNDISVTAGTQLKYKIFFANQASGSKVTRVNGVSLSY